MGFFASGMRSVSQGSPSAAWSSTCSDPLCQAFKNPAWDREANCSSLGCRLPSNACRATDRWWCVFHTVHPFRERSPTPGVARTRRICPQGCVRCGLARSCSSANAGGHGQRQRIPGNCAARRGSGPLGLTVSRTGRKGCQHRSRSQGTTAAAAMP